MVELTAELRVVPGPDLAENSRCHLSRDFHRDPVHSVDNGSFRCSGRKEKRTCNLVLEEKAPRAVVSSDAKFEQGLSR